MNKSECPICFGTMQEMKSTKNGFKYVPCKICKDGYVNDEIFEDYGEPLI